MKEIKAGEGGSGGRGGRRHRAPPLAGETPAGPPPPPPAAPSPAGPARAGRAAPAGNGCCPSAAGLESRSGTCLCHRGPCSPRGPGALPGVAGFAALPEVLRGFCRSQNSGVIQREPDLSEPLALGRYRTFKAAASFCPDYGYKNHEGEMRGIYSHFGGFPDWDWICAGKDTKPSHRASRNRARIKSLK